MDPSLAGIIRKVIRKQARIIEGNAALWLETESPEALHDLRVGLRRARVACGVFSRWTAGPPAESAAELQRLGRVSGPLRDLDVYSLRIQGDLEMLGTGVGTLRLINARLHNLQALRGRELKSVLEDPSFFRAVSSLRSLAPRGFVHGRVKGRTAPAAAAVAAKILPRMVKRTRRLLFLPRSDDDLHLVRRRIRRVRYAAEFLSRSLPASMGKALRDLVAMQDILGELQDSSVAIAILARLPAALDCSRRGSRAALKAVSGLLELEQQRLESRRIDAVAAYEGLDAALARIALISRKNGQ